VKNIGFEWMMFGIGVLCFVYAPLLLLLKAPPTKEEKKVGEEGAYVNSAIDMCDENECMAHDAVNAANSLLTKL
jgi:hypothetical protein